MNKRILYVIDQMSHYGQESISIDTKEGLPDVDEVNKTVCVPLYALLNNYEFLFF